ncbi:MAG TPA: head GIN domain-containing protein [Anaerolineaceae bacterium]|nr:head GIN domain-containing protein [Anaerolineaceae bacterium]
MAIISESRSVQDFDEVVLQIYGDIQLIQGDQENLMIEADEELLPKIKTEVRNRRLVIKPKSWLDWLVPPNASIRYRINMREVRGLAISGAGTLSARKVQTDQLRLEVTGSAEMIFDHLEAQALRLNVSGAGRVEIGGGQVQRQEVAISGTGNLRALRVDTQEADLRISGSGQVQVNVHETMKVAITGFGSVRYAGDPKVSSQITGAGRIEKIG